MVTGQSVNDNQTRHSSLTTQPSRTNTYPALSLSLCLSATLSLSNTHTLAAVFAFCVSSLEHVSFLLLFFSLSVSLAVCSPPLPPLSLSSPLKLIFSFKRISLWQRCDWGCVFNRCVHWGPESASLTLYLCVWSLWVGEGSFTGYLLSVLDEAERVCVCEQSLCVSLSVCVCVCGGL